MAIDTFSKSSADVPSQSIVGVTVKIEEITDRKQWATLSTAAAFTHLPQNEAYGIAKTVGGRWSVRHIGFRRGDRIVAIANLLQLRVLGVPVLARINRGPVFIDATPSETDVHAVYHALRRRWGRWWRGPLLIATALEANRGHEAMLTRLGMRQWQSHGWRSGRVDLTLPEDDIWARFSSTFRNRFRNAEKAAVELRVADDAETYEWMLARHLENMQDKQFQAAGAPFLRSLRQHLPEGNVLVFQMLSGGEPIAGMSIVRFGDVCEYHIGWFGPAGRQLNAGNFLMWNIMREMKRRGCRSFDVGGMSEGSGYTQFKRTMRPTEYQLAGDWWSL